MPRLKRFIIELGFQMYRNKCIPVLAICFEIIVRESSLPLKVGPGETPRFASKRFQQRKNRKRPGDPFRRTDYSSFGIGIFKVESERAALEFVQNDPAVKNKVMRAELYPYRIALFKPENAQ